MKLLTAPEVEWATDLFQAALGYYVASVGGRVVELYGHNDIKLRIETPLASGALLRRILRPEIPDEAVADD